MKILIENTLEDKKKEYNKEYYRINRQKIIENNREYNKNNKEKKINTDKKYYLKNKEKINERKRIYNLNNKEKISEQKKEYHKKNKEKINKYKKNRKNEINKQQKNRKQIDPLYKLRCNIGSLISKSIKRQGYSKKSKTFEILGCTYEDFKQHLERQFTFGMNWENQGEWHLDHIIPISSSKNELDMIKLNHYTNLQPLWAIDNIIKGNKIIENTQIKLI
jgi:hypothetical protein